MKDVENPLLPNLEVTKIISLYNIGTELEYLGKYEQSLDYLRDGLQRAVTNLGNTHKLTMNIEKSIQNVGKKSLSAIQLSSIRRNMRSQNRPKNHFVRNLKLGQI